MIIFRKGGSCNFVSFFQSFIKTELNHILKLLIRLNTIIVFYQIAIIMNMIS